MTEFKSCTTCKTGDNSINGQSSFVCPLRMSDGRSFGDEIYTNRCEQQYQMQFDKKFTSNFEYRQFLMQNAEAIMKQNQQAAFTLLQS